MRENNLKTYKQIVHNLLGKECQNCGGKDNLHIHHINGNHKDNNIKNIKILCRKCHFELHRSKRIKLANNIKIKQNEKVKPTKKYFKNCQICSKLIESNSKEQFNYNKEQHIEAHKRHQKSMKKNHPDSYLSDKEKYLRDNGLEAEQ